VTDSKRCLRVTVACFRPAFAIPPRPAIGYGQQFVSARPAKAAFGLDNLLPVLRPLSLDGGNMLPDGACILVGLGLGLPVKQSQAWCRFGTVIGKNMQRSPASGALAAVARAKQGLEHRSVALDEETFNLDFVMEERLACPTSIRFLTVRKLAVTKQRESIW
jgi:hypothetical protein